MRCARECGRRSNAGLAIPNLDNFGPRSDSGIFLDPGIRIRQPRCNLQSRATGGGPRCTGSSHVIQQNMAAFALATSIILALAVLQSGCLVHILMYTSTALL
jgi:hypothetical protein